MLTSLLDYELPEAAIAQRPLSDRDAARLLVVARDGVRDARFRDWAELVPEGSLVVFNDTRVLRARILGTRPETGGRVELLLTTRIESASHEDEVWLALGRANRPLRPGARVVAGALHCEVLSSDDAGTLRVRVTANGGVATALETHGHVPLPPYVRRPDDAADAERYQTVFAKHAGSVAAPTAGLHATEATLGRLRARGVATAFTTLHVGVGTFRPVSTDDLDDHVMHEEHFSVSPELAHAVDAARRRGGAVVAVGTTVVRSLESARDPKDPRRVRPATGTTRLLIQPGYAFGPVDALLTNFHMPKSTLLALVAAFAGRDRMLAAYRSALELGYRFLSYGDAMWVPERLA
ncbi:MAG TPA: tRNA preQ1(34) S-adenosylmethionine ribosyltransferase-isomerase QueA [Polyangiaceae bacterium]|nr:tRNA preQ1(34) S-adenosylmethionine ribosyltransferase-isomerase QueA [Polyangiaceae bacterium]